ncbi:hypothetical protein [Limnohabitans sp.]|uniref:DUF7151 family protein n=1 Tax=Limnohabitans sp. TaxID=1907725 RepID=UPI00286F2589|nr:hypothetical protein [Limnohabitans sp.]
MYLRLVVGLLIAVCMASCGGSGNDTRNGAQPSDAIAVAMLSSAPIASCPNGGITVQSGVDINSNHVLELSEATNEQYVCNGSNGTNGVNGSNGNDGVIGTSGFNVQMVITSEPPGSNCSQGGSLVRVGLDLNRNSILDTSEVTSSSYICKGTTGGSGSNGSNGKNGLNSLIEIHVEPAERNCLYGGSELTSGLDANSNQILDAGEITSRTYVCNSSSITKPIYAYIFNLSKQVVAIHEPVRFDSNGLLSELVHEPGAAEVRVLSAGIYTVAFSISGAEPSQFAIFVNENLVLGSIYGSGAGTQQNNGQITLALIAKDVLTVVNYSSDAAVSLPSKVGGSQVNVNASVRIEKID